MSSEEDGLGLGLGQGRIDSLMASGLQALDQAELDELGDSWPDGQEVQAIDLGELASRARPPVEEGLIN